MMDDLRLDRKKLDELFNILGYKRGSPTRNQASLKLETLQFLQRYESEKHGRKIPPNKRTDPQEARLCACNFLEEEGRAERFFPPNAEDAPVWPQHMTLITEAMAHVFRFRAFNNKQLEDQKSRRKREQDEEDELRKTLANSNNNRHRSAPSTTIEDYEPNSTSIIDLDPKYRLKTWSEEAERFNRPAGIDHVRDLNPIYDTGPLKGFTKQWLQEEGTWPVSADRILSRFMHERNFYFSSEVPPQTYIEAIDLLRKGTELETFTGGAVGGAHFRKLEERIGKRITDLTNHYERLNFLRYQSNGWPPIKTSRFQTLWDSRLAHWTAVDVDQHQSKKRRKAPRPLVAKSPITFPNLVSQSIARPNELSNDNAVQEDLEHMAYAALDRPESDKEELVVTSPTVAAKTSLPEPEPLAHLNDCTRNSSSPTMASVQMPQGLTSTKPQTLESERHTLELSLRSPLANQRQQQGHQSHQLNLINSTFPASLPPNQEIYNPEAELQSPALGWLSNSPALAHGVDGVASPLSMSSPSMGLYASLYQDTPCAAPSRRTDSSLVDDVSSGVVEYPIGLSVLPNVDYKVQCSMFSSDVWPHPCPPDMLSDVLTQFCQHFGVTVPVYREWWDFQDQSEREKRSGPRKRIGSPIQHTQIKSTLRSPVPIGKKPESNPGVIVSSSPMIQMGPDHNQHVLNPSITHQQSASTKIQRLVHDPAAKVISQDQATTCESTKIMKNPVANALQISTTHDNPNHSRSSVRAEELPTASCVRSFDVASPTSSDLFEWQPSIIVSPTPKAESRDDNSKQVRAATSPQTPLGARYLLVSKTESIDTPSPVLPSLALESMSPTNISGLSSTPANISGLRSTPSPITSGSKMGEPTCNSPMTPSRTPSRAPSPIRGVKSSRPYAYIAPLPLYSPLPEKPTLAESMETPAPMSTDLKLKNITNIPKTPTKRLDFVFKNENGDFDFDNPIPFSHAETLNTYDFFVLFARNSGVSLASLHILTVSLAFGNQQSFVVERYGEKAKWERTRSRLEAMFVREKKKSPTLNIFELWVEIPNKDD